MPPTPARPRTRLLSALAIAGGGVALGLAILAASGRWASTVELPPNPDGGVAWASPLGPRDIVPEDPPLLVSRLPLDLGTVAPNAIATGRLTIANPGRRPLEIRTIRPLCSCLTIVGGDEPAMIAAGATRTLEIRMEAPDLPDRTNTKKIRIVSRRHDPMDVTITVRTTPDQAD